MYQKNKETNKRKVISTKKKLHLSSHRISGVILATFFWYHAKQTEENLAAGHELSFLAELIYSSPFKEAVGWELRFLCGTTYDATAKTLFSRQYV